MVDWYKLFWGKKPSNLFECEKALRGARLFIVILLVALAFVFFGVLQQKGEVSSCWDELEQRRFECPSLLWDGSGGLVEREEVIVSCGGFEIDVGGS